MCLKTTMLSFDKYGDKVAIILDDGRQYTYNDLIYECNLLQTSLKERTLLFCMCSNTIETVIGYVTCINNGIVPLMLDENIDPQFFLTLISEYKPDYIWVSDNKIDSLNLSGYTAVFGLHEYSLIKTEYNSVYELNDQLALLLTTSGSTGSHKLVRITYNNIIHNAIDIINAFDVKQSDVYLAMMPLNYTFGLMWLFIHLYSGASVIVTQKTVFDAQFWDYMRTKATVFAGVPYTYQLMDMMNIYERDITSIRSMTVGGGKLNNDLYVKYMNYLGECSKKFINAYGQTEGTTVLFSDSTHKHKGIGLPCGNNCAYIEDDNGVIINSDYIDGELVYKGENVALGYAQCGNDLIKGDEFGGVLHTGDIVNRDSDGFFYVVGRKKRFIKLFGMRVSLDETEHILRDKFENFECACVGVDDKMSIYITDESKLETVRSYIHKKLNISISAFVVKYVENIPKNHTGKIMYSCIA